MNQNFSSVYGEHNNVKHYLRSFLWSYLISNTKVKSNTTTTRMNIINNTGWINVLPEIRKSGLVLIKLNIFTGSNAATSWDTYREIANTSEQRSLYTYIPYGSTYVLDWTYAGGGCCSNTDIIWGLDLPGVTWGSQYNQLTQLTTSTFRVVDLLNGTSAGSITGESSSVASYKLALTAAWYMSSMRNIIIMFFVSKGQTLNYKIQNTKYYYT